MNKGSLVSAVANALETKTSDANFVVEAISKIINDTLMSGEEFTIPGVGKLKVSTRPGRVGRNPATGVAINIPSKRVVKFVPSAQFDEQVSVVA